MKKSWRLINHLRILEAWVLTLHCHIDQLHTDTSLRNRGAGALKPKAYRARINRDLLLLQETTWRLKQKMELVGSTFSLITNNSLIWFCEKYLYKPVGTAPVKTTPSSPSATHPSWHIRRFWGLPLLPKASLPTGLDWGLLPSSDDLCSLPVWAAENSK